MDLSPLLPREHVVLPLGGADRAAVLAQLVAPLVAEGLVQDAARFCRELEAREQQVTTQMDAGVAFPHARSDKVQRLALVVGLAPAPGLWFSGPERDPCRVFFLIAVPSSAPTVHLGLLAHLSAWVRQEGRLERLLAARTLSQVQRALGVPRT